MYGTTLGLTRFRLKALFLGSMRFYYAFFYNCLKELFCLVTMETPKTKAIIKSYNLNDNLVYVPKNTNKIITFIQHNLTTNIYCNRIVDYKNSDSNKDF